MASPPSAWVSVTYMRLYWLVAGDHLLERLRQCVQVLRSALRLTGTGEGF